MQDAIRNLANLFGLALVGAVVMLASPDAATAQEGSCAACLSDEVCSNAMSGGASCSFPCETSGLCGCSVGENGNVGCIIIPEVAVSDAVHFQLAQIPEAWHAVFTGFQHLDFVRVATGTYAAWDCGGALAFVLKKRPDGMFVPSDVRDWRGRLAKRQVAENGKIIVTVI